jgi:hypothetical protein
MDGKKQDWRDEFWVPVFGIRLSDSLLRFAGSGVRVPGSGIWIRVSRSSRCATPGRSKDEQDVG